MSATGQVQVQSPPVGSPRSLENQCQSGALDRQFAGGALSWSYRPYPAPVLARSHGMGDASRRSHHCVGGAFEGDPFGRQATHLVVCTHLRADQGASGDEVVAHAGDRSRNRTHSRTSSRRAGRGLSIRSPPFTPSLYDEATRAIDDALEHD
jgi:hypothetical protein